MIIYTNSLIFWSIEIKNADWGNLIKLIIIKLNDQQQLILINTTKMYMKTINHTETVKRLLNFLIDFVILHIQIAL